MEPLRRLGRPLLDTVRPMSYAELQTAFDATNPPGAWYYKTGYLDGAQFGTALFVETFLDHCDFPSPSPLSRVYLEHLGGAMGRVPADQTAFVHRAAPFDLIVIAGGFRPEDAEKNVQWARAHVGRHAPLHVRWNVCQLSRRRREPGRRTLGLRPRLPRDW